MYKNKKIAVIIPARKGSKGIPNKNIALLGGIPLIEHTIKEVIKVKYIDKIVISTDSIEICEIAEKYHIEVKGLRPEVLSNDTAILYDVIRYEISNYNLLEFDYEVLVLLQPTSPLRRHYMIENALINFIDENQTSALSVSEAEDNPIFIRKIDSNNKLVKVLDTNSTVRRQDLPIYYRVNGMIYINRIKDIVNNHVSLNDNTSPIIIPKEYAIDIDTLEDLKRAEIALGKMFNFLDYKKQT